ncbi:MAG TPA: sigma-E factor negative regulatory protein [Burkholderiaceae bacterium]|jgi:negative regulator of sigma E activity|nr:sigma-E factor negative regulatory protein [Burkholderiaceae bacterium]
MTATRRTDGAFPADADLEQLSAWLDGELEGGLDGAMLDRVKSDPKLRAQFEWFNLAGDALRSHEVAACHRPRLVAQVCRALDSEPVRIGPGALSARVRWHIAAGITVAAAAGVLAVVALPQLRGGADLAPGTPAAAPTVAVGQPPALAGGASRPAANALAARNTQLDAYFRAHRELATTGVMPSAAAYIRMSGEPDR